MMSLPVPQAIATENTDSTQTDGDLESVLDGFETSPTSPQTEDNVDRVLDAFDETPAQQAQHDTDSKQGTVTSRPSIFDSKSYLRLSTAYNYAHEQPSGDNTDYRGLSQFKLKLQSEITVDIADDWKGVVTFYASHDAVYDIHGRDQYTDQVLSSFENEAEMLDTYVEGTLTSRTDLKAGRQIIPWGTSENIRVLDVLNPLDLREPGMTDIADLRLPVTAAKFDYYQGNWNLSVIAIPEIRFNKLPPYGSDFYPGVSPPAPEQEIKDGESNTEYAMAWKGIFQGWDLSFHWAEFYDDNPHHELKNGALIRTHSRLTLRGVGATGTYGNWLMKSEFAEISGLEYFSDPGNTYQRLEVLIGLEYSGFDNSVWALESVKRRIDQYRPSLFTGLDGTDRDTRQTVIRYTGSFHHDRLSLSAIGSFYGKSGDKGYLYRVSSDYEIRNSVTLTLGIVSFHGGDDPFLNAIKDNDRVFFDITYNF